MTLIPFRHRDKWGAISLDGRVVVPFAYDLIFDFEEGLAPFQRTMESKFGFLDETGAVRIEEQFEFAMPFHDGLSAVTEDWGKSSGYLDPSGAWAIAPTFEMVNDFSNGRAAAQSRGKWGIIDKTGAFVVEPTWDNVGVLSDDCLAVYLEKKWGLVDRDGNERAPRKYKELGIVANGRVAFLRGKKWGFLDCHGNEIVKPTYAKKSSFTADGFAAVELDGKHGIIDRAGNVVIPIEHDEIGPALEGRSFFRRGAERGFYDYEGKVVIRGDWTKASGFREGFSIVDGARLVDRDGNVVATIDFAGAPSPTVAPAMSDDARLAYDDSRFGPYFQAALAAIGPPGSGDPSTKVTDAIEADFPDSLKAYLLAVARRAYFHMSCFEVAPAELRFQPSKRRVCIGRGDHESHYWAEWSRGGDAAIVQITPSEEIGVPDQRTRWGRFDAFFEQLWKHQLMRGEPCDPEDPESHRAFAEALALALR